MKDGEEEKRWVLCPWCGAKTRLQILRETELVTFPLFCPKCRHESIINAKNFIIETKQPDAKTQCLLSNIDVKCCFFISVEKTPTSSGGE